MFQFTEGTFLEQIKKHAPEAAEGLSRAEILELRKDPEISRVVAEGFTAENAAALEKADFEASPANLSLLHFAGRTGGLKVLGEDDKTKVRDVLSKGAVKANPFLKDWTVKQLKSWAAERVEE